MRYPVANRVRSFLRHGYWRKSAAQKRLRVSAHTLTLILNGTFDRILARIAELPVEPNHDATAPRKVRPTVTDRLAAIETRVAVLERKA